MTSHIERWWNKQYPTFLGRELPMHHKIRRFLQDTVVPTAKELAALSSVVARKPLSDATALDALTRMARSAQLQLSFGVLGSSYELRSAEHFTLTLPGHDNIEILLEFFELFPDIKKKIADLNGQDQVTIIFYGGLSYMDVWHQMDTSSGGRYLQGEEVKPNVDGFILRKFRHEFDSEET